MIIMSHDDIRYGCQQYYNYLALSYSINLSKHVNVVGIVYRSTVKRLCTVVVCQ